MSLQEFVCLAVYKSVLFKQENKCQSCGFLKRLFHKTEERRLLYFVGVTGGSKS